MLSANDTKVLAAVVLAGLAAALVCGLVHRIRRSPYTTVQAALLTLNKLVTRILWRAEVVGSVSVPRDQGVVLICNHRCPLDPGIIALGVDRIMHWMVAKEYCDHWLCGAVLRPFGMVPTRRSGHDTAATKLIVRYAQEGQIVGVLPEGRINDTERFMLPGRPGAAMIALKARVPVVPCYIDGAPYDGTILGCLFMPAHVRLTIGRPIDLSPYYGRENERAVLEELTKRFMLEIAKLAGRSDFEPEIAGRFYKPDTTMP
ncbi:MAG: 1-acyl-sn-glycerol-3-phosphate acyltransferase [Pirellulales bacterium]|nr:1-acyl-sn-glycerol-3-phosphate acyltransferase [Pirellulales bacterium]